MGVSSHHLFIKKIELLAQRSLVLLSALCDVLCYV